ncbi:MAG: glycosyltransferase [Phycisphaeraceae bacterium]
MRVAIVHDWFTKWAGSEQVVARMLGVFPEANLYAGIDVMPAAERGPLGGRTVRTSPAQNLPGVARWHGHYLPLLALAIEQLDLSAYDLVISSSHAIAHGVLTGPDQLHLCLCHSPMRFAWDLQHQYLAEAHLHRGLLTWPARIMLARMRRWDLAASRRPDRYIAVSQFIARRIAKCYRRPADVVIYPPVDVAAFPLHQAKEDFYVTAGRFVPYKRTALIVAAFAKMPDKKLIVIGDGPERERVKARAGPNVTFLGHAPAATLVDHLQRARAFIFAALEDFGIAPVEAMLCGTPVIAFGQGGATETVTDNVSGLFFGQQTPDSLIEAVHRFESQRHRFVPEQVHASVERFSSERFDRQFKQYLMEQMDQPPLPGGEGTGRAHKIISC